MSRQTALMVSGMLLLLWNWSNLSCSRLLPNGLGGPSENLECEKHLLLDTGKWGKADFEERKKDDISAVLDFFETILLWCSLYIFLTQYIPKDLDLVRNISGPHDDSTSGEWPQREEEKPGWYLRTRSHNKVKSYFTPRILVSSFKTFLSLPLYTFSLRVKIYKLSIIHGWILSTR